MVVFSQPCTRLSTTLYNQKYAFDDYGNHQLTCRDLCSPSQKSPVMSTKLLSLMLIQYKAGRRCFRGLPQRVLPGNDVYTPPGSSHASTRSPPSNIQDFSRLLTLIFASFASIGMDQAGFARWKA
jgi:hypothetical protein